MHALGTKAPEAQGGTGAFTPNGELEAAVLPPTIVTPEELKLQADNRFSSSQREIRALQLPTQAVSELAPHLLRHRSLQYCTLQTAR